MIQRVPTMTHNELATRLAMYARKECLSTADWQTYDACRAELHRRQTPPWTCPTCDDASGSIAIEVATITCPLCRGSGSLLPEPDEPEVVMPANGIDDYVFERLLAAADRDDMAEVDAVLDEIARKMPEPVAP